MASPVGALRGLLKKQDVILMALCALLAAGFLALAASNVTLSASFLTIDSLFFTTVCLLLALIFLSIPALYLKERGVLGNPFAVGGEVPPARVAEHIHFEGSTKLFLAVLGGLLVLTLVEVVLAYIHLNLVLMLVILMGLSLIKAALIMAYFMHLKFERMSLVLTLVPILVVCICLLLVFFPDSLRSRELRATKSSAVVGAGAAEH
jgi:cytochrome c oxidase subunit 4